MEKGQVSFDYKAEIYCWISLIFVPLWRGTIWVGGQYSLGMEKLYIQLHMYFSVSILTCAGCHSNIQRL